MSWWSKKVKKHMGKIGLAVGGLAAGLLTGGLGAAGAWALTSKIAGYGLAGALVGGAAGNSIDNAHAAAKLQEQQADEAKKQAEEQKKATLAAAEAESINADRAALKTKKKYGRASTVLGGTVAGAGGAGKRLMGE